MFSRLVAGVAAVGLLGACAMNQPGWRSTGAEPFDQAKAECEQKASIVTEKQNREHIFEDCMAAKGWTRPHR